MIISLYGPNVYLRQRRLRGIVAEFRKKYGSSGVESFDLAQPGTAAALMDFCRSQALFSPKKLAVASGAFAADDKELKNFLKEEIAEDADTIVVLNESIAPPPSYKSVLLKAKPNEKFEDLKEEELDDFIRKEAARLGVKLSKTAANELREKWGKNLWGITTDLEVLALGGRTAKSRTVPDFFPLINGLRYGDLRNKVLSLTYLLDGRSEDPTPVFNVLSAGTKNPRDLRRLAQYDFSVKSGGLEHEEALLDLALSVY
ncbi:MAG: hypothetical protein M1153_00125 [Patescibacteria group bacterium]|nr:hypothetical protein [Patescibacteria group bacterium]